MSMIERLKRWFRRPGKQVARPAMTLRPAVGRPEDPAPGAAAVDAPPAGPPAGKERRHGDRVAPADGIRVLVVDDSPTITTMLSRMLSQNGYLTREAADAERGMEIALEWTPHLIFLDIVLPGMNGFEALRRLRRDPKTSSTPVIMISGNELATEQFYAQRIGADDFMKKPFSRSEVFARVESLLGPDRKPMPHVSRRDRERLTAAGSGA